MSYYQSNQNNRFNNRNRNNNYGSRKKRSFGQYIDPSKFIRVAKPVKNEEYIPENKFTDFDVDVLISNNLERMGYVNPSPIQDKTIPVALTGKDVVGIANTGTGKTAAFLIPVVNKLMNDRSSRALILAPTRELAEQIEDQTRDIAKGSGLTGALLIGGVSMQPQLRDLRSNPQIIIGTPGRVKDHIERRTLKINDTNIVVLDEVDRMLDMGFIDDITEILNQTSSDRQSFFFSATMEGKVKIHIDNFSNNPVNIMVKTGDTSENVHQNVVHYITKDEKLEKLHDILTSEDTSKTLIFDDTHRNVEKLNDELLNRGFKSDAIHGGKSQAQRQRALKKFKDSHVKVLVATDVAARGIDVSDITHVVNFSVPQSYDDYVHRIGRAGRAGRVGHALTFIEKRY
jgi:superfamily II DNA/RNA helicase